MSENESENESENKIDIGQLWEELENIPEDEMQRIIEETEIMQREIFTLKPEDGFITFDC